MLGLLSQRGEAMFTCYGVVNKVEGEYSFTLQRQDLNSLHAYLKALMLNEKDATSFVFTIVVKD